MTFQYKKVHLKLLFVSNNLRCTLVGRLFSYSLIVPQSQIDIFNASAKYSSVSISGKKLHPLSIALTG